jgi:nucleoside-diphosphate-sugar epimerase
MPIALITGVAGFIGSHLAKYLNANGWTVIGCDNFSTPSEQARPRLDDMVAKGVIRYFFECNVSDLPRRITSIANTIPCKIDCVFHLAAIARVQPSFLNPLAYMDNNLRETWCLLDWAKERAKKFIFASSSSVYGNAEQIDVDALGMAETDELRPMSPYAFSKKIGEDLCKMYSRCFGMRTLNARFFNVYGEGMAGEQYKLVIQKFLDQFREQKPLTINGDGLQKRDFTHVSDVVVALGLMATVLPDWHMNGGAMNLGAGDPQTVLRIAELIGGSDYPKEFLPPVIEPRATKANNDSAVRLLGWAPKVKIEIGVEGLLLSRK